MHGRLRAELRCDDVVVCPHDGKEGCWCRKPRPGMILDAARRLGLDLDHSVAVGDRWRDIDAAHRAGVASVWIDWGLGEPLRDSPGRTFWLSSTGTRSCPEGLRRRRRLTGTERDRLGDPHVKIFADGADLESIIALADDPRISGFTTNPTLMRKAGVDDYEAFARKVLETITGPPDLLRGLRRRVRPRWCARPG